MVFRTIVKIPSPNLRSKIQYFIIIQPLIRSQPYCGFRLSKQYCCSMQCRCLLPLTSSTSDETYLVKNFWLIISMAVIISSPLKCYAYNQLEQNRSQFWILYSKIVYYHRCNILHCKSTLRTNKYDDMINKSVLKKLA